MRLALWPAAVAAGLLGGCARPPQAPLATGQAQPSAATHVQVEVTPLGELPNNGVFLPAVSPDGQRVAYLEYRGEQAPSLEAVLAGQIPPGMSLHVRSVEGGGERLVAPEPAAWPAWSADSRTLYYVTGDGNGPPSLGVYDLAAGRTSRRIQPGAKAILMPAISADGRHIAFIAPAAGEADLCLHVLEIDTGQVTRCPAGDPEARHAWPQWSADGRLVYLEATAGGVCVCQWVVGQAPPRRVRPIGLSNSPMGLFQACAGLARPLSPDGRWLACYDALADAVVLTGLIDPDKTLTLRAGTHGGCWLSRGEFVAAAPAELVLFATGGASSVLMRGMWLPIGPAAQAAEVLVCTRGRHPGVFQLVRMRVGVPAGAPAAPPTTQPQSERLVPGREYRGMAFLASNVGPDVSVDSIVQFVQAHRIDLVVFDFAWITHHWPMTDFDAINDATLRLQQHGVLVAAMYRPRVLRPSDAQVHYAQQDGHVAASHNELCLAHDDSVAWGCQWGTDILTRMPSLDTLIVYNLRSPCSCPQCSGGRGRQHAERFLRHCREQWSSLGRPVQIGHVGAGDEYAEAVDFLCPFLAVNREGERTVDVTPALARLGDLAAQHPQRPVVPLVKVCWAEQTNNTSQDIVDAIRACRKARAGFLLWYYDWIFCTPSRYDGPAVSVALAEQAPAMVGMSPQSEVDAAAAVASMKANEPGAYDRVVRVGEPAVAGLAGLLADQRLDGTLRFTTANALGDIGSASAVPALLKALKDPFFNVRRCSALALGKIGDERARQPLQALAKQDPFAWRDPDTGKVRYLVREDARKALEMLGKPGGATEPGKAVDAAKPVAADPQRLEMLDRKVPKLAYPPAEEVVDKLPWPHQRPGLSQAQINQLNRDVWVINDFPLYQADEDGQWRYIHGGLDIVLDNGTKIYAIKDGWVKAVTGSSVVIGDLAGPEPSYGWEYSHLGNLQVKVGDHVTRGTYIGDINFQGLPHIHLSKVYSQGQHWGRWRYMCMPNAHFTFVDEDPPVIAEPLHFFRNETDTEFRRDDGGNVVVSGPVDIVVGIREAGAYARAKDSGFGDRLGVTRIECTISPQESAGNSEHQIHSFDFNRLKVKQGYDDREYGTAITSVVYKHWRLFEDSRPHGSQCLSYYVVTNCRGTEPPDELTVRDGQYCWDTSAAGPDGALRFPNGKYTVTVTAYDASGNTAVETGVVEVAN